MTRPTGTGLPGPPTTDGPDRPSGPLADPAFVAGLRPIPSGPVIPSERWPAADVVGESVDGKPTEIRIDSQAGPLLLCFLQTQCDGCAEFWRGPGDLPAAGRPDGLSVAIVTRGAGAVDRSEVARLAAGAGAVPVVMSDRAWADYRVTGYPFFVLVDPSSGTVIGETVGFGWADVHAMVRAADNRG